MGLNRSFRNVGPLVTVAVIGTILSFLAFAAVARYNHDKAAAAFAAEAVDCADRIVDGFAQAIFAIESVGAFYSASPDVTTSQFAEFTAPLLNRFETIAGLGWVPNVTQESRVAFERVAQKQFPGFRITEVGPDGVLVPAGQRAVYFPVLLIRHCLIERRWIGLLNLFIVMRYRSPLKTQ